MSALPRAPVPSRSRPFGAACPRRMRVGRCRAVGVAGPRRRPRRARRTRRRLRRHHQPAVRAVPVRGVLRGDGGGGADRAAPAHRRTRRARPRAVAAHRAGVQHRGVGAGPTRHREELDHQTAARRAGRVRHDRGHPRRRQGRVHPADRRPGRGGVADRPRPPRPQPARRRPARRRPARRGRHRTRADRRDHPRPRASPCSKPCCPSCAAARSPSPNAGCSPPRSTSPPPPHRRCDCRPGRGSR